MTTSQAVKTNRPDEASGMSGEGWKYVELELNADERRSIAYAARSKSQLQDDFRYWNPDPTERQRLKERWRDIAEAFYPTDEASGMSDDLITWLRAQLDEDEQDARRRDFHAGMCSRFLDPGGDCSCDYSDFVLAEVEAKRQILDIAKVTRDHQYDNAEAEAAWWLISGVVSALALPYADRSGYREEWRP